MSKEIMGEIAEIAEARKAYNYPRGSGELKRGGGDTQDGTKQNRTELDKTNTNT